MRTLLIRDNYLERVESVNRDSYVYVGGQNEEGGGRFSTEQLNLYLVTWNR